MSGGTGNMAGEMASYSKESVMGETEDEKKKKRKKAALDSLSSATKGWGEDMSSDNDEEIKAYSIVNKWS